MSLSLERLEELHEGYIRLVEKGEENLKKIEKEKKIITKIQIMLI